MRTALLCLALAGSLMGLAGCASNYDPNSPAMQAMNNPPNACGPGGTAAREQCSSHR